MTQPIYLLVTIKDMFLSTDAKFVVWRWSTILSDLTEYEKTLKERGFVVRILLINPMAQPSMQDITEQVGRL